MPAVSQTNAAPKPPSRARAPDRCIVVTGNPNCGKTTLFNALTGLRAKVGNYAGVTVERKEGRLLDSPPDLPLTVLDLPGTYSLSPKSLDEQISRDVLLCRLAEVPPPDAVLVVVDASNLERNLYYATQVIELGYPTLIALNMTDVAADNGHQVDIGRLAAALGVPVVPTIANTGEGLPALRRQLIELVRGGGAGRSPQIFVNLPEPFTAEVEALAGLLTRTLEERPTAARAEALLILSDEHALRSVSSDYPETIKSAIAAARERLEQAGIDWRSAVIEARYGRVGAIQRETVTELHPHRETFSDRVDRVVTHKVWGLLIFLAIMALMFQSIFSFAEVPMNLLEGAVGWLGEQVGAWMPPGALRSLLVEGVIAGVGAVVVFLPQICLLFLFIGLLEDTGYMARAAFLMDRLMSKVGLHGKSFIPMLSSFACAIPGIMATRTIESPKDRLATILIAPLMSCSARLPVYALLIAAAIPDIRVWGVFRLTGLTMLSMYLLGIIVALAMAWLLKKTLLKGEPPMLIMELPPYKRPVALVVVRHMWDRSKLFLRRAGTVILGINIILWFLASYPRDAALEQRFERQREELRAQFPAAAAAAPAPLRLGAPDAPGASKAADAGVPRLQASSRTLAEALEELERQAAGERLRHSFAGRAGHWIEPLIRPLGFDWKIGIGIVASFAAREVFVSTMSVVYNVGSADEAETATLAQVLREQQWPDGRPVYTMLTAVTLMVFYVLALQCVSTVAVVRRETNSWKWPVFQWAYMGVLAWVLGFITYQGGKLLGFE
jgi:ferrous iron transport protein B